MWCVHLLVFWLQAGRFLLLIFPVQRHLGSEFFQILRLQERKMKRKKFLHCKKVTEEANIVYALKLATDCVDAPFSSASICSCVKDVRFLCNFLLSCRRICVSSESSPFELMELVFSPAPSCCWQPSAPKGGKNIFKYTFSWPD